MFGAGLYNLCDRCVKPVCIVCRRSAGKISPAPPIWAQNDIEPVQNMNSLN